MFYIMAERARDLWTPFCKSLRSPPSWPKHLPKEHPLLSSHWSLRFQHMSLGDTNIWTIAPLLVVIDLCFSFAHLSPCRPPTNNGVTQGLLLRPLLFLHAPARSAPQDLWLKYHPCLDDSQFLLERSLTSLLNSDVFIGMS